MTIIKKYLRMFIAMLLVIAITFNGVAISQAEENKASETDANKDNSNEEDFLVEEENVSLEGVFSEDSEVVIESSGNKAAVTGINVSWKQYSKYGNGITLSQYIGVSKTTLLNTLEKNHASYLAAPYCTDGYDDSLDSMNCEGFVERALNDAGKSIAIATGAGGKGWVNVLRQANISYRTYYSEDYTSLSDVVVNDGYAQPGDIIWMWDGGGDDSLYADIEYAGLPSKTSALHHVGIFVGNYFSDRDWSENRRGFYSRNGWWHSVGPAGSEYSSRESESYINGMNGNYISNFLPKSTNCKYITVIKMSNETNTVQVQKKSMISGTSYTQTDTVNLGYQSMLGAEYALFQCDNFVEAGKYWNNSNPTISELLSDIYDNTDYGYVDYAGIKAAGKRIIYEQKVTVDQTDSSGNAFAVFKNVPPGIYFMSETKAPEGYSLDKKVYKVNVGDGSSENGYNATIISNETPDNGYAYLVKKYDRKDITGNNSCYTLSGAKYGIYKTKSDAENNTNVVETLTTNAEGKSSKIELAMGTYYVKEITAPKGALLDKNIKEIKIDSSCTSDNPYVIEVTDEACLHNIEILVKKTDEVDSKIKISDAQFTVKFYADDLTSKSELSGKTPLRQWILKSDSNGEVKADDDHKVSGDDWYYDAAGNVTFPHGTLVIEESKAPEGYHINSECFIRQISDTSEGKKKTFECCAVKEKPIRQAIEIIKLAETGNSQKKVLKGAGFKACNVKDLKLDADGNYIFDETKAVAFSQDGKVEMFTDDNGYAKSGLLRYGTYIVRETTVPKGYLAIDDFTVTVTDDTTSVQKLRYFTDDAFKAYLRVIKVDEYSKKNILSDNAAFKIWSYEDEKYISFKVTEKGKFKEVDEFTTDDGVLMTPGTLICGDYRLDEVKTPEGYFQQPDKVLDFTIEANSVYEVYEDGTTDMGIYTMTVSNTPIYGRLNIQKYEKASKATGNGDYIAADMPMENIKFNLYAREEIESTDGQGIAFEKDELVETLTTDENGQASTTVKLPAGKYYVSEVCDESKFYKPEDQEFEIILDEDNVTVEAVKSATDTTQDKSSTANDTSTTQDKSSTASGTETAQLYASEEGHEYHVIDENLTFTNYKKITIKTTASDAITKTHEGNAAEINTIKDVVSCENLIVGKCYLLKGEVVFADTLEPVIVDGESVKNEVTFTAQSGKESVDVLFANIPKEVLAGRTIVVYERLYENDVCLAEHVDSENTDQMVSYPKIGTSLTNTENDKHIAFAYRKVSLNDTVTYSNLVPNKEYELVGVLYRKSNGQKLTIDGEEVTSSIKFTPTSENGTQDITFEFDSDLLLGDSTVAYEYLYADGKLVAEHSDLSDVEQTVDFPEITTLATAQDGNTKELECAKEVVLVDKINYSNLTVGYNYIAQGTVMDKETGEPLYEDGKMISKIVEFTPSTKDGTVNVEFAINTEKLENKKLVVYETIFVKNTYNTTTAQDVVSTSNAVVTHKDTSKTETVDSNQNSIIDDVTCYATIVAEHKIIDDEGQTVTVNARKTAVLAATQVFAPKTGDGYKMLAILILLITTVVGAFVAIKRRSQRKK